MAYLPCSVRSLKLLVQLLQIKQKPSHTRQSKLTKIHHHILTWPSLTDTKAEKFRKNTTRPTSEASSLPSFKTLKRANPAGVSKSANMVEHCRALVTPTQRDWNVGLRNHEARLQGEQRHLQLRCGASSQWGIREAAFLSRRGRSSAHARSLCCKRGACGCPRRFKT
jgi:hypothetical protein